MVLLLEFGITYANVYHIGRGDVNAREVMRANLWIWGFVTAVGLVAAGAIIYFKGAQWFPGIPAAMMIVAVFSFPPNLLQFYCRSILQGYQDFRRYNYLTVIVSAHDLGALGRAHSRVPPGSRRGARSVPSSVSCSRCSSR